MKQSVRTNDPKLIESELIPIKDVKKRIESLEKINGPDQMMWLGNYHDEIKLKIAVKSLSYIASYGEFPDDGRTLESMVINARGALDRIAKVCNGEHV